MADRKLGVLPVVQRGSPDRLRGLLTQFDLLRARGRMLEEERHREKLLQLRVFPVVRPRRGGPANRPVGSGVENVPETKRRESD